jgi:5-(carboxyamino)imidazole ribonucleotide synthase
VAALGTPCVLKTAAFGYDGKGQRMLRSATELSEAFTGLGGHEGIYEAFVDFAQEVSVVGARTVEGQFAAFPVFENVHAHHILDVTVSPARITPELEAAARELSRGILEALDVVGLLTVELFVTRDGKLIVNELAPRTHNSGHLTLDACITCQFEQQVRAVCGLPLGSTELKQPAAMANLLGDVWNGGPPRWDQALSNPRLKLHLYGKTSPRPGRKMGHITATADSPEAAIEAVRQARSSLRA